MARDRDLAGLGIVALAALLRLGDLGRRSLWLDEAWAALGILDGRWEVAPGSRTPIFDALVRGSAAVLGRNEAAVRLPAAVFAILAVVVAWRLGRAVLGPGGGRFAAAIVGLLPVPVYYGKELKPYSAELCLALGLAALVRHLHQRPRSAAGWTGLVASVAIGTGLTPIAPALAAGAFAVLLPQARRAPAAYAAAGLAAALAAVAWLRVVFLPYATASSDLAQYWRLFFLPSGSPAELLRAALQSGVDAATWGLASALPRHADRLVRVPALPPGPAVALVLAMLAGGVWLWRCGAGWLPALALAWHLVFAAAAAAGRYPYGPARISFFFLAPTALLLAAGASAGAAAVPSAVRPFAWLLVTLPLYRALAGTWRENVAQPFQREELRPVLQRVLAARRPDDAIWVSPGARFAFRFYVPAPDARVTFGGAALADPAALRAELAASAAANGRVWAIFAHNFLTEEAQVMQALGPLRIRGRWPAYGASALLLLAPGAAPPA